MIEPIQSLAFSVQANPKVYALLLGSGVSRSAEIPTGWEIVLDLLGKLAASMGEEGITDLGEWYYDKYQEFPDYSKILDALVKKPSERQQLLRPYFEPSNEERTEGLKQPTAAHKAIARLVAQGFVKVIVTTNFDRLIEKALEDEGIVPTVLSTEEQVKGALPLDHIRCCIFKIHGDYLDSEIRNTQSELDKYPKVHDKLLDRILDEYGLIVCGWSGIWDTALRNALFRAQSRRFTTYWTSYGDPSDEAQRLIAQRSAEVIPIDNADFFFQSIEQTVTSIEEYSKPHPLSTEAAVKSLKRYLSTTEFRIQLSDLVNESVEEVMTATTGRGFEVHGPPPDKAEVTARLRRYEAASSTLLSMATVGGFWLDNDNVQVWERAIERLSTTTTASGTTYPLWRDLSLYPGVLLLYTLGISAIEAGNLHLVYRLFRKTVSDTSTGIAESSTALAILSTSRDTHGHLDKFLEGMENNYFPSNDWIHAVLRQPMRMIFADDAKYSLVFDKFEMLAALGFTRLRDIKAFPRDWFPLGSYIWRLQNQNRVLAEIEESISALGDESPFVKSGIFGTNSGQCLEILERFKRFGQGVALRNGIW